MGQGQVRTTRQGGKIPRGTVRKIANGETYEPSATIDDPRIPPEIAGALENIGYTPT